MDIESARAVAHVELTDERLLTDLATQVQVHRVKQPEKPIDDVDAFEGSRNEQETELVWLQEEKKTVYRVIEAETGEVIQQVPSEEVLRVGQNIKRLLTRVDPNADLKT